MSLFRYCLKILIFLAPLTVIVGLPFFVLWKSNEFASRDVIIKELSGGKRVLLGNAYWPIASVDLVKLNIEAKRPKVITLGNSRVLQFRSEFFEQNDFVNAGGTIGRIGALSVFLDNLPKGYKLKVIILGLEQSYFNPNVTVAAQNEDLKEADQSSWQMYMSLWPKVYMDYFSGKFSLARLFLKSSETKYFGLNALINSNGLRNDGSYYYGKYIKNPQDVKFEDYNFKDTDYRIRRNCCRFERSTEVSKQALSELEQFLEKCSSEGIHVIGFLPPYPHVLYERLMSMNDEYSYISKLMRELSPIFKRYNFSVFDFSDLTWTGAGEKEYIDGLHASEKAYLRIWIKMAESDKVLFEYADLPTLKQKLAETKNDYEVFANE